MIILVTTLCLVTHIRRLCLHSLAEAEPLEIGSQALLGNQLTSY